MSVQCDRRTDGSVQRIRCPYVAALVQAMMVSSIVVVTGCGPVDPAMQWRVYEARPSDKEVIRITVLEMEKTLGGPVYSSPIVELTRSDGASVIIRLYDKPELYEVARLGREQKETRIPLRLVFKGLNITELSGIDSVGE